MRGRAKPLRPKRANLCAKRLTTSGRANTAPARLNKRLPLVCLRHGAPVSICRRPRKEKRQRRREPKPSAIQPKGARRRSGRPRQSGRGRPSPRSSRKGGPPLLTRRYRGKLAVRRKSAAQLIGGPRLVKRRELARRAGNYSIGSRRGEFGEAERRYCFGHEIVRPNSRAARSGK